MRTLKETRPRNIGVISANSSQIQKILPPEDYPKIHYIDPDRHDLSSILGSLDKVFICLQLPLGQRVFWQNLISQHRLPTQLFESTAELRRRLFQIFNTRDYPAQSAPIDPLKSYIPDLALITKYVTPEMRSAELKRQKPEILTKEEAHMSQNTVSGNGNLGSQENTPGGRTVPRFESRKKNLPEKISEELKTRGLSLESTIPGEVKKDLAELFDSTPGSISVALAQLRKKAGISAPRGKSDGKRDDSSRPAMSFESFVRDEAGKRGVIYTLSDETAEDIASAAKRAGFRRVSSHRVARVYIRSEKIHKVRMLPGAASKADASPKPAKRKYQKRSQGSRAGLERMLPEEIFSASVKMIMKMDLEYKSLKRKYNRLERDHQKLVNDISRIGKRVSR